MFLRRLTASLYRIHPFLFVIYFPIALLAANLGEVLPASVLRPLLVSVCFALIAWGFSWLLARNWDKAALMASAAVVLFFSYGHVYGIVKTWVIGDVLIGRHRLLTPLWGILWLAWCWWVIQARRNLDLLGKAFCVVALTLMFMPGFSISRYYLPELFQKHPEDASDHPAPQQNTAQTLPDVYYIILDAYGRSDVIKDLYDYDNSSFISYLKEKGFFVADESHSNYNQTVLSLPSSLNMDYINDLAVQMGAASTDRRPLLEKIADNQVSEIFKGLGYQFVTFDTGSLITQIKDSDIYLSPSYQNISQEQALLKGIYLDDFEGLFLKTTMARVWFDEFLARQNNVTNFAIEFPYIKHRVRILYIFDQLGEIPAWNGNYFVFAHIFSPHPPFVFGSQSEMIQHSQPISFQDTGCCSQEEYINGYHNQVIYITKRLQQTIDQILSRSAIPPIIIVQGDHGPGAYYDGISMDELKTYDRMSILNAYYFPKPTNLLYPSITPVNSFRVLFASQFNMDFPLLADMSYFSPGNRPYEFSEIPLEWLKK